MPSPGMSSKEKPAAMHGRYMKIDHCRADLAGAALISHSLHLLHRLCAAVVCNLKPKMASARHMTRKLDTNALSFSS